MQDTQSIEQYPIPKLTVPSDKSKPINLEIIEDIEAFNSELAHALQPDAGADLCELMDGMCSKIHEEETIEFYYPEWAFGAEWISTEQQPSVLEVEKVAGFTAQHLATCHRQTIFQYKRPRQSKLKCRGLKCTLYCRSAADRFHIDYCHPSINRIIGDVIECQAIALVAAGGAAVVIGGGAAWPTYVAAWQTCITNKVGAWGKEIQLRLGMKKWRGPWGKC